MWVFKPFTQKERTGLEGRYIDVGSLKIHVLNVIAEGGFSCVYLARDPVNMSKQYALKHIICNDGESLELVMKEISVMKSLRGHPNVVTLCAHTILDMGRTREALLVMEFCEKSLVQVLESRGSGYFEEKQVLLIFRDVCNAVFAMHCQSPPIAHRDLKAENLLLGSDGLWILCDFGSTTTNHKRFDKPEEMGIEEDNIRKHTTPAYRAPEMWDLFRREVISEKVDIWALGCLLFRICYFKSAFDGESKLQVLNGNYRIPEMPKYSSFIVDMIKDMLQASPEDRPDITQVWFRVNEKLPANLQKSLPDRPPELQMNETREGLSRPSNKASSTPHRNPPPPPSGVSSRNFKPSVTPDTGGSGGQLGAFWSTQHAKASVVEDSGPKFDEPAGSNALKQDKTHLENLNSAENRSSVKEESKETPVTRRSMHEKFPARQSESQSKDFEIEFFNKEHGNEKPKVSTSGNAPMFKDDAFNSFVAEFDTNKFSSETTNDKRGKEETLESEVERLKEELRQAKLEKAEITSKFEKLSAICRSQRQELQELKQALASRTPSPNKDASRIQASPIFGSSASPLQEGNSVGTSQQHGKSGKSFQSSEWQAFPGDSNPRQPVSKNSPPKSVRTRNGHQVKQSAEAASNLGTWGFETEKFTAVPASDSKTSKPFSQGSHSERFAESKMEKNSQPAGWAGF